MTDKKYTLEELKKLKSQTDHERLKNMSDEEIEQNSRNDEDCLTPTDEQLLKFRRVKPDEK